MMAKIELFTDGYGVKYNGTVIDDLTIVLSYNENPKYKYIIQTSAHSCINKNSENVYSPLPSSRNDEFFKNHRFETLEQCKEIVNKYLEKKYNYDFHVRKV